MNKPLRIACFSPLDCVHTWRWLDHLHSRGHEMYVFTGTATGFTRWTDTTRIGLRRTPAAAQPPRKYPSWLRVVRPLYREIRHLSSVPARRQDCRVVQRLITHLRPDIIHAQWLRLDAILASWLHGWPLVLTAWGSDIRQFDQLPRLYRHYLRRALRTAAAVTAGSQELLQLCQTYGATPDRCYLLGVPGISIAQFRDVARSPLHEQLGLSPSQRILLSCRAVRYFYRIELIIRAFAVVASQYPDCVLVIIRFNEDPEYYARIRAVITELRLNDVVRLIPTLPYEQMAAVYHSSAAVISVPERDGLPQSVYEAFAANCPVIASDLTTYDGVITHEISGLRVPGNDPRLLAAAIERVLTDTQLCVTLRANGQKIVRARGDIVNEMRKLETIYRSLEEQPAYHD